jgi:hypothetical protein
LCLRLAHLPKQVAAILLKRSVYISISVLAVKSAQVEAKQSEVKRGL